MAAAMDNAAGNKRKFARWLKALKRDRFLLLMFLPIFIYYIVFHYIPMPGAVVAFKNYVPGSGLYGGDWVGLKWFREFFDSPYATRTIRNTVLISLYTIVWGFPVPIVFALCINEVRSVFLRRTVQTASYLPHFISTVVLCGMLQNMLAANTGIVNNCIAALGGKRISFLMDPKYFRTIHVASGIWQNFGFNSILYIAAIAGVDPTLYEAGKIDGIRRFEQAWYITLPMISPTIIILFILELGGIMSVGFEKVFLLYSPAVYETADVISTYVYRKGIDSANFGYAAAVGLFNSVINFLFIIAANEGCRKTTQTSLW